MHQDMTLYQTATTLLEEQHPTLALTVYLFYADPAAICLLLICLIYSRRANGAVNVYGNAIRCGYSAPSSLGAWLEVFLIGVLVSLIKDCLVSGHRTGLQLLGLCPVFSADVKSV